MNLPEHLQKALNKVNRAIRDRKSVLLRGPAGCGKTMLALRVSVPYKEGNYPEVAGIRRMGGLDWAGPAFRAPHHTASITGLVGDGKHFRPGELSLAHGGVLFLNEVDEFSTRCLEAVAHAWENKCVEYGLNSQWLRGLPADFALIGAFNTPKDIEELKGNPEALCVFQSIANRQKRVLDIIKFDVMIDLSIS